jgi:hypothetical protein
MGFCCSSKQESPQNPERKAIQGRAGIKESPEENVLHSGR